MKVLFVGDIHNHQYMIDDIQRLDKKYQFDKIILFGDYVDDWNTDNHDSLKTLEKVFSLKHSEPDKYVILLGNHELSYIGCICSGHCFELDDVMRQRLFDEWNNINLYYEIELDNRTYFCSHAGLTKPFYKLELKQLANDYRLALNMIYNNKMFDYIKMCSSYRGGDSLYSSILWADRSEHYQLLESNETCDEVKYQIIGHSPVKQIINYKDDDLQGHLKFDYWFIDTHSTYRDGTTYGDRSYLIWNEDKFKVVF